MDDIYYRVTYCLFCGSDLSDDFEDEVMWTDENEQCKHSLNSYTYKYKYHENRNMAS